MWLRTRLTVAALTPQLLATSDNVGRLSTGTTLPAVQKSVCRSCAPFPPCGKRGSGDQQQPDRCRLGNGADYRRRQSVGGGKRIERSDVGESDQTVGAAVTLTEIRGQGREIAAVYRRGVEEVSLVPVGNAEAEIGGEDAEIGAVDASVKVGIADERIFQLELPAGKAGDGVRSVIPVREAYAVFEAVGGDLCR